MSFVLDCSATLAFLLPNEITPIAQTILDRIVTEGAFVPSLWRLEVANSLSVAVRRKRVSQVFRDAALRDLAQLDIKIDNETDNAAWKATLELADSFDLTLYDAAYLELAVRRRLPLVTLDTKLCAAAQQAGIRLLPAH